MRSLVYGLAVTGASTVRALARRGHEVVVVDDHVDDAKRVIADELGVELLAHAGRDRRTSSRDCDLVSPSPGVPETHDVIAAARRHDVPVRSEIELAYQWEQDRPGGARPILAVTGTDGKTTTSLLAAAMLTAAGLRTIAAGNTDVPLVDALEMDLDAYVVECSSFRLAWTEQFRANAALWLNLAPDHLNWHRSTTTYEAAKARLFDLQRPSDVAIGYVDDPIVMRHLDDGAGAPRHVRAFERRLPPRRRRVVRTGRHDHDGRLDAAPAPARHHQRPRGVGAGDRVGSRRSRNRRPGDRDHSSARPTGSSRWASATACSGSTIPRRRHRTRSAVAIHGFEHVVLIAGGRNKGLDLSPMAAEPQRLRSVVAIGEAADGDHRPLRAALRGGAGGLDGSCRRSPPPMRHAAATRCSCRPAVRASTGTRTVATPHVAIISAGWSPTWSTDGRRVDG